MKQRENEKWNILKKNSHFFQTSLHGQVLVSYNAMVEKLRASCDRLESLVKDSETVLINLTLTGFAKIDLEQTGQDQVKQKRKPESNTALCFLYCSSYFHISLSLSPTIIRVYFSKKVRSKKYQFFKIPILISDNNSSFTVLVDHKCFICNTNEDHLF